MTQIEFTGSPEGMTILAQPPGQTKQAGYAFTRDEVRTILEAAEPLLGLIKAAELRNKVGAVLGLGI